MNTETLTQLGLTQGEIKTYLALFELEESTVGPISKTSGVTHAKTYPILEKLIAKGLVSHIIKENRKYFSATNPNNLLEFIGKKQKDLEEEKSKIKKLIPLLLSKQKQETQYARVFEGFKGLRSLFQELFSQNQKSEILVFGLNEILKRDDFRNFFLFYHEIRNNNKIKLKLILNKNLKELFKKHYLSTKQYKSNEIKFLNIILPVGIFIIANHVITIITDNKVTAFDIKSKQNAEQFRNYFMSIWQS